jgi:hypothetical protein
MHALRRLQTAIASSAPRYRPFLMFRVPHNCADGPPLLTGPHYFVVRLGSRSDVHRAFVQVIASHVTFLCDTSVQVWPQGVGKHREKALSPTSRDEPNALTWGLSALRAAP